MTELTPFTGPVWRIMFANQQQHAASPVQSPIGRFHHSGQTALYTSLTETGATTAIQRYIDLDDPDRVIIQLNIIADRIFDIRQTDFVKQASVVWQDCVEKGLPSPTWKYSDAAREAGAQGMLYSSRSRPDLTHFVLFDVSDSVVTESDIVKPWTN